MTKITKNLLSLLVVFVATLSLTAQVSNQSPEQMKADIDTKKAEISALQGEIDAIAKNLAAMDVFGWRFGGTGGATFSANGNKNWNSLPNSNSGLNVNTALNVFGNYQNESWLWFNGLNIQENFLVTIPENALDNPLNSLASLGDLTLDKLYFQSLAGRRLTSEWSASGLFDLSSSFGKFLSPGQISAGVGATWTPVQTMNGKLIPLRVVIHPLTWQATIAQPLDALSSTSSARDTLAFNNVNLIRNDLGLASGENIRSSFGTKFIADYARTLKILGNNIGWTTQLRGFAPYNSFEALIPDPANPTTFIPNGEATGPWTLDWENAFSILLFKNIALSANWNLRRFKPESTEWQHLWNAGFGLSTTF